MGVVFAMSNSFRELRNSWKVDLLALFYRHLDQFANPVGRPLAEKEAGGPCRNRYSWVEFAVVFG